MSATLRFGYFIAIFLLGTAEQLLGAEHKILEVAADALKGRTEAYLAVDKTGAMTHLRFTGVAGNTYRLSALKKGVTVVRQGAYDVIRLEAAELDADRGGVLIIDYLTNGLDKTREAFPISLIRGDRPDRSGTDWKLFVDDQRGRCSFDQMTFKVRKVLGQVVGIEKIEVNCQPGA